MNPSTDRSIVVRNVVIGLAILAAIAAAVVFWNDGSLIGRRAPTAPDVEAGERELPRSGEGPPAGDSGAPEDTEPPSMAERRWTEQLGRPPVWPGSLAEAPGCPEADRGLAEICELLDSRSDDLERLGGACALIEQVGEELAAQPPRVVSELRSPDAWVANVYHLARVLGRERTRLLKRALDAEEELVEPASMAIYRWVRSREGCVGESPTSIRMEPLYEYAAFLFNTMGGQAYMRRRSPRVESLACFYALQILDAAEARGHNPYGVDPRPEIGRCRGLIRGQEFVFGERYLEILDEMERRWGRR